MGFAAASARALTGRQSDGGCSQCGSFLGRRRDADNRRCLQMPCAAASIRTPPVRDCARVTAGDRPKEAPGPTKQAGPSRRSLSWGVGRGAWGVGRDFQILVQTSRRHLLGPVLNQEWTS